MSDPLLNPSQIGTVSGMTGLLIATVGTDAFAEVTILRIALILIVAGIVSLAGSMLIDLGVIATGDAAEVTADA